ncbi:hypothetical protein GECvBN5_gp168 [Salmonella phage GEC_vB_N5]|uniref:Uncharacterized protein n=1 Tax=Salmonella phage GEC_vB_N5 TaxID=2777378 RepID=A0A7S9SSH5_9CAUD|nr:hypothetical protein GECvBN5_gp168 [Salmonella phage GEC_vB_N5]
MIQESNAAEFCISITALSRLNGTSVAGSASVSISISFSTSPTVKPVQPLIAASTNASINLSSSCT